MWYGLEYGADYVRGVGLFSFLIRKPNAKLCSQERSTFTGRINKNVRNNYAQELQKRQNTQKPIVLLVKLSSERLRLLSERCGRLHAQRLLCNCSKTGLNVESKT